MELVGGIRTTTSVIAFAQDEVYGSSCANPIYIATVPYRSQSNFNSANDYTLTNLLSKAKKDYGEDVTISNIRYDVMGPDKAIVGVVYDVINCKTQHNQVVSIGTPKNQNSEAPLSAEGSNIYYGEKVIATLQVSKFPQKNQAGIEKGDLNITFISPDFMQSHKKEVSKLLQSYYPDTNWNFNNSASK